MIKVYKQKWLRRSLVGWIDDEGKTYDAQNSVTSPRPIRWSSDRRGRIFLESAKLHGLIGHLRHDGTVYAEYGNQYGKYGHNGYQGANVFWVKLDGSVYGRGVVGTRRVGIVEGTSDLHTIAALALLLLLKP